MSINNIKRPKKVESIVPKIYLNLLNQIFELERKLKKTDSFEKVSRNLERMKDIFLVDISPDMEISYEDPLGQKWDDTRLDLDAHIIGDKTDNLIVVDVIKPIIRIKDTKLNISQVVQIGIVTVESKNNNDGK